MVELFSLLPDAPPVFHCDRLHAALTPASCSANFASGRQLACIGCEVGRHHAGSQANPVRAEGSLVALRCSRCTDAVTRLIANRLCRACATRELEVVRCRNSKGKPPVLVASRIHQARLLIRGVMTPNDKLTISVLDAHVDLLPGGALATLTCTSEDEAERWLKHAHPASHLVDFELGPSLATLRGWGTPKFYRRSRSRDNKLAKTSLKPQGNPI